MFKWKPIGPTEARECLEALSRAGVPLVLSVPMLLRARGVLLQKVLAEADCHRSHLHACLRGRYQPNRGMRAAMTQLLGCDPWEEWELAQKLSVAIDEAVDSALCDMQLTMPEAKRQELASVLSRFYLSQEERLRGGERGR